MTTPDKSNTESSSLLLPIYPLRNRLDGLIDKAVPRDGPLELGLGLLRLGHRAELERIQGQLLQQAQILPGRGQPQERHVEVMAERRRAPEGRIVRRDHHRVVVREVDRPHVVPVVVDQLQDLVRDRVELDADVALFDFLQHSGVLDGGKAVADTLRSQQDDVNLWGGDNREGKLLNELIDWNRTD